MNIINDEIIKNKIQLIERLTCETKENFSKLYIQSIKLFIKYHNNNVNKAVLRVFNRSIVALKLRQGSMLPPNSDAETCYREQHIWTLAIFLVALLYDERDKVIKNNLAPRLIPGECIDALHEITSVFDVFAECFRGAEDNVIINIVRRAKTIVAKQTSRKKRRAGDKDRPISVLKTKKVDVYSEFISWLKTGIGREKFDINTRTAVIYRVTEGLFLVMPAIVQSFLREKHFIREFLINADYRDLVTGFLDQIAKKNLFIRNTKTGLYLHEYYSGNWDAENYVTGLLLNYKKLNLKLNIPLNCNLRAKPKL